jgi:antibiotic biosynthesis monooxygenase (ABM) superfamily enzyme
MPDKNACERESEVVRRCRRVRQELYARFKTPQEMHAWLMSLERQAGRRRGHGKAQAQRQARPSPRRGKTANGKPIHKT